MRKFRFARTIVCTFVLAVSCAAQQHLSQHNWDYGDARGPSHWGDLEPEFATCKNGHHQSPIDIRNPKKAALPPIHFEYKPSPLHIIDNGHTVMVNYSPGSFISVGDKKYALKQFHFHRPSEEKINGKAYEMAVHLVHEDQDGNLGVVAVLLQTGDDNPLVHELWNDLPNEKEKEEILDRVQINAGELLPADRGYYTYPGALTTPPCSENVTWFVLKHAATVSTAEIAEFSKLYRHNVRPTQPLYNRVVLESQRATRGEPRFFANSVCLSWLFYGLLWQPILRSVSGWENRQVATQIRSLQIRTDQQSRIQRMSRNLVSWNWSTAWIARGLR